MMWLYKVFWGWVSFTSTFWVVGIPHAMRISDRDMLSQAWLAFSGIKIKMT